MYQQVVGSSSEKTGRSIPSAGVRCSRPRWLSTWARYSTSKTTPWEWCCWSKSCLLQKLFSHVHVLVHLLSSFKAFPLLCECVGQEWSGDRRPSPDPARPPGHARGSRGPESGGSGPPGAHPRGHHRGREGAAKPLQRRNPGQGNSIILYNNSLVGRTFHIFGATNYFGLPILMYFRSVDLRTFTSLKLWNVRLGCKMGLIYILLLRISQPIDGDKVFAEFIKPTIISVIFGNPSFSFADMCGRTVEAIASRYQ